MQDLAAHLQERLAGNVRENEPLSRHTSLRIGGPADIFVTPASPEDVVHCIEFSLQHHLSRTVIGGGSNVLIADAGIRGLVLHIGRSLATVSWEGPRVVVGAGASLPAVASMAAERKLTGLEFGAGIPGTIGGSVVMNAGVPAGEIASVVRRVQVVNDRGQIQWLTHGQLKFAYRSSCLLHAGDRVVVAAEFQLAPGDPGQIRDRMQTHLANRRTTQPVGTHNCGSVFKNPPGDYAGRLVEAAGCKGMGYGNAEISTVHANFVINRGGATATEVVSLIDQVRGRVRDQFGVELELEMRLIGFSPN